MIDWNNLTQGTAINMADGMKVYFHALGENESFTATYENEDGIPCFGTFYRAQATSLA